MAKPSLDEIFGGSSAPTSGGKPSLDEIFNSSAPASASAPTAPIASPEPQNTFVDPGSQFGPAKLENFVDLGKGAVKGALSTANNLSQAGQSLFRPINNAVLGAVGQKQPENQTLPENLTTPNSPSQQVGFGAEQLAEFLLPMGEAAKAEKGIKAAIEGAEVPNIIKTAGKVATRAGIGAATGGGVALAQQGKINDNVIGTALLSGAIPGAQEVLEPVLSKVLPSRLLNSLIKPGSKEFAFGKNPGLALANEGIVSNTLGGLKDGISSKLNEVGSELGAIAKQTAEAGGTHDAASIIKNAVPKAVESLPSDVERNVFNNRIKSLFTDYVDNGSGQIVPKVDEAGNPIMKDLTKLPSDELHKLQTKVGQLAKWTGEAGEKGVNKIFKNIYGQLGQELDKSAVELTGQSTKALQQRYANLLGAQNAVENRIGVATRQAMVGGKTALAATVGGTQGKDLQEHIRNAILGGLLEKFAESTVGSPLAKSGAGAALVQAGESQLPKLIGPATSVLSNSKITSNPDKAGLDQILK